MVATGWNRFKQDKEATLSLVSIYISVIHKVFQTIINFEISKRKIMIIQEGYK